MKKIVFILIMFMFSMSGKSQVFVLGNPSFPTIGGMVHFQTMDIDGLGFYNYIVYGHSNKTNEEMENLKLGAGLSYYFSANNDPQICWRIYWGFNKQVFWNMTQYEDLMFPTGFKDISFDLGVSKSFDFGLSILVLLDPLNNLDYKIGLSYYF